MPRPRLTVRRLMILVVLVALALTWPILARRSSQFEALARDQAEAEALSLSDADDARGRDGDPQRVARGEQMAAYHRALKLRYLRAARYPWITPDPAAPVPDPP